MLSEQWTFWAGLSVSGKWDCHGQPTPCPGSEPSHSLFLLPGILFLQMVTWLGQWLPSDLCSNVIPGERPFLLSFHNTCEHWQYIIVTCSAVYCLSPCCGLWRAGALSPLFLAAPQGLQSNVFTGQNSLPVYQWPSEWVRSRTFSSSCLGSGSEMGQIEKKSFPPEEL